jgi:hypothetical protein
MPRQLAHAGCYVRCVTSPASATETASAMSGKMYAIVGYIPGES